MLPRLQYISQGSTPGQHLENCRLALEGGCTFVQLRLKNALPEVYARYAVEARTLCDRYNARLVINDDPHVAQHCRADALHLGLQDMDVHSARKVVQDMMIGGTANTFEDILQRSAEQVDYAGLGPYRFTRTKDKLSPVLGAEGYRKILQKMRAQNVQIPVYAIGGITTDDVGVLIDAGVYGVAVSGAITEAREKEKVISEFIKRLAC